MTRSYTSSSAASTSISACEYISKYRIWWRICLPPHIELCIAFNIVSGSSVRPSVEDLVSKLRQCEQKSSHESPLLLTNCERQHLHLIACSCRSACDSSVRWIETVSQEMQRNPVDYLDSSRQDSRHPCSARLCPDWAM